jgi:hypothetical protein
MKSVAAWLCAGMMGAACGGSDGTDAPMVEDAAMDGARDGRPSGNDATDAMADAPSVDETALPPGDARFETSTPADAPDGDASCIAVANGAAPVDESNSSDPLPMALGGSILDGTYFRHGSSTTATRTLAMA